MIRCKLVEYTHPDATQSVARVDRAVSGEVLDLGRGAACKIHLPDPRVRLHHGSIHRAEDGFLYLEAAGPVFVNQRVQTHVRLALGQKITIGPYDFVVDSLEDGPALATARITLSFAQRASAQQQDGQVRIDGPAGLRSGWLNRRRLAWVFSLVVLVAAALPVWHAFYPPDQPPPFATAPGWRTQAVGWVWSHTARLDTFWNPGQISSAHRNFAQNCRACHDKPFERVADGACTTCHKNTGTHVADQTIDHDTFQGQRCASCHKEHQGLTSMRTVDALGCEQCHANVRAYSARTDLGNVSDFGRDHPEFRLSIRQAGNARPVRRVAQTAALRNDTGLRFPHAIHLARAGIKSPTGPVASGGRVVLECAACHRLDAAGARFEPVRMESDCQGCHRLSVDPQAPRREVPHGKPADVAVAVREIYASLAVDRFPVSLVTVNSLLQRPQAHAAPMLVTTAGRWVQQQTGRAMTAMMDTPTGVCRTCHAVEKQMDASGKVPAWLIRPVVATEHWLPKSRFTHARHQNAACGSCHAAQTSRTSADILIPDLASCRNCHAGAKPDKDKVVSRCDACHGFHSKTEHPAFRQKVATTGARH